MAKVDLSTFKEMGRNVRVHVEGDILFIAINIKEKGQKSASGKTNVRATTNGNKTVPGTDATLGLNYYDKEGI